MNELINGNIKIWEKICVKIKSLSIDPSNGM